MWQPVLGIGVFILVAFCLSEHKKGVRWKLVTGGVALQFLLALVLLKVPFIKAALLYLNKLVLSVDKATTDASGFLFGYLGGATTPFEITNENANFVIAFRVLPLIIVVSALSAALFHLRVLPVLISLFSRLLQKVLRLSGVLTFGAASTIFLGTIEAPIFIKPWLKGLSRSELFALLCASMSTIAGTVMVLYATVLEGVVETPIVHMLTASVISVPAALVLAHLWIPGKELSTKNVSYEAPHSGLIEAVIDGAMDGLKMVLNIVAVILVLFAFVSLINQLLPSDYPLQVLVGTLLRPVVWLTGIPWQEAGVVGKLMATKIVLNEFVAFIELKGLQAGELTTRSKLIATYALCGFANFASLGIISGGLSVILPERKAELISLTSRSLVVGNLATLSTACVIALFL